MSLLMEALKKAEQAKQSGDATPEADAELRLEPIDATGLPGTEASAATPPAEAQTNGGKQLPELPSQLEVLDADFMAHAAAAPAKRAGTPAAEPSPRPAPQPVPPAPPRAAMAGSKPPRPAAAGEGERKAAQQVFAAKQPERSRKNFAITMAGLTVAGAAAIGAYFWWQLQPKSGLAKPGLSIPTAMPAAPAATLPQVAAAPPAPVAPATASAAPPAAATAAEAAARSDDDADEAPAPRRPPARTVATPAPADPSGPVRITRSQLKVNPALARGYESFNAGDLSAAQADYERVLKSEPKNGDALHGLAAIALRHGDVARAEDYWLKALEADPKDAVAQAALISSGGRGGGPQMQESRLKTLIAGQPEIAALHFALGNVFARQSRWSEAQQSYFKAFSIESEHPDYAFNLAVSLDQLRQPRLAAQYYRQALDVAAQRPAGFDKAQAAARLRELQP